MRVITIKASDTESGSQNTYIIEDENGCVLIDAGASIERVYENSNLPIKAVLITHAHYDHIEFVEHFDKLGIPVYMSVNSKELLENAQSNASDLFNNSRTFEIRNFNLLNDEQEFVIGSLKFIFYLTPGHTKDSGCYLLKNENILFSGDTLFSAGIGRVDLPTGSADELKQSLNKLLNIDYSKLYPGHGDVSDKKTQDKLIPKWQRYLNIIR